MICPYNSRILQTKPTDCGALAVCDRGDVVMLLLISASLWHGHLFYINKDGKTLSLFLLKRLSILCWYINLLNVWGVMGTQIIRFKQRTPIFVNGGCKEKKAQQRIMSIWCDFKDSLCTQKSWCCCFCLPWRLSAVEAFFESSKLWNL